MKKQCLTIDDAVVTPKQHTKPCSDCPWARTAVRGWLAGETPAGWVHDVLGEFRIDCHTKLEARDAASDPVRDTDLVIPWQCAGAAIHRANILKLPRSGALLRLPQDKTRVFATSQEFFTHHKAKS